MADQDESKKHLPKASDEEVVKVEKDEMKLKQRLASYVPQKGDHASKFLIGLTDEKITIDVGSIEKKTTIFIANCSKTEVEVKAMCTKIMMQGCNNCKLTVAAPVLTNTVEIWQCDDTSIDIVETLVATLQVDLCKNFVAKYSRKKLFHKLIWAALDDYKIEFVDDADATFSNSYDTMAAKYPDVEMKKTIAQFIDSLDEGRVRSERLLRLRNGFPTTEREQEEFDQKSEKNRKLAEEHYRGLVDKVANDEELKKLGIKTIKKDEAQTKAAKPNEPCPCKSGAKYKKCCGNPAKAKAENDNADKSGSSQPPEKKD
mmetsp:Transcript_1901/g.5251  ORF Transcript_1901/g.5251 Transcript_1901/m.5251 type:complete len:315 (+) Transcript_1901:50-994(+)